MNSENMKKGVTPVVAVIMLLLIVISLVGGIFVWMRGTMGKLTEKGTEEVTSQLKKSDQTIAIQSVDKPNNNIYVKHTGDEYAISTDELDVYQNEVYTSPTWQESDCSTGLTELSPDQVACVSFASLATDDTIRIVAPGNSDSATVS